MIKQLNGSHRCPLKRGLGRLLEELLVAGKSTCLCLHVTIDRDTHAVGQSVIDPFVFWHLVVWGVFGDGLEDLEHAWCVGLLLANVARGDESASIG